MHIRLTVTMFRIAVCAFVGGLAVHPCAAQVEQASVPTVAVRGIVRSRDGQLPVGGASVQIAGTTRGTTTREDGTFSLAGLAVGPTTLTVRRIGFEPKTVDVNTRQTTSEPIAIVMDPIITRLSEMVVNTASRVPERIVQAPAAITVIQSYAANASAPTNQVASVLRAAPGFDVVQSGMNDFNINARGFNSALNRRVLVLQDGRDLSFALLGAQEWASFPGSIDELGKIEVIRGPGSALYGPNALNGVVNITTPPARDVLGTKMSLSSGEVSTLRADLRHAQSLPNSNFAFKVTAGYDQSDTFSRSRTRFDSTDIVREYAAATDEPIKKQRGELKPLRGQTVDPTTGVAVGERDPLRTGFGTGRLDYYSPSGALGTAEVGFSQTENEVFITTIGRAQVYRAQRPYARMNWGSDRYYIMGSFTGRRTPDPQIALSSGTPLLEFSETYNLEAQMNRWFASERGRWIGGASARAQHLDTKATLLEAANDDRVDRLLSVFGQMEYSFSEKLKAVAGARVDDGNLYAAQLSPKAAIVFSPNRSHSIRITANRAFQPPNPPEHFLHVTAAAPTASPQNFEKGVEAYFGAVRNALTSAGAGAQVDALKLPTDLPFNFASLTPVLALGNHGLKPQTILGYEIGYRGEISKSAYFTADAYLNRKRNFVTALLPGVNPDYARLLSSGGIDLLKNFDDIAALVNSLPIPDATKTALLKNQPALKAGYNGLSSLATTLADGNRALVLSYANAGEVRERGIEFAAGLQLTRALRMDASYTRFAFEVTRATLGGDRLVPNTPKNKGSLSIAYSGTGRFDAGLNARVVESYPWLAGVFDGNIPAAQIINANAGWRLNNNMRAHVTVTDLFDQKRYELYGGSVNGRRVLAGVTASR